MTRDEYCRKWCEECMRCKNLIMLVFDKDAYEHSGHPMECCAWVFCLWANGRMERQPEDSKSTDMVRKMVLDERNIWTGCPTYADRIVELYNLDD